MSTCSILLGEPSPMLREKIAGVLGRLEQIWCIAQVGSAGDLERAARAITPDLILADLILLSRPNLMGSLRQLVPLAQVLGLVDSTAGAYLKRASILGLDGLCSRMDLVTEVSQRVERLLTEGRADV